MNEELNERKKESSIEKEQDLDLEALLMNPKTSNSIIIIDAFF